MFWDGLHLSHGPLAFILRSFWISVGKGNFVFIFRLLLFLVKIHVFLNIFFFFSLVWWDWISISWCWIWRSTRLISSTMLPCSSVPLFKGNTIVDMAKMRLIVWIALTHIHVCLRFDTMLNCLICYIVGEIIYLCLNCYTRDFLLCNIWLKHIEYN